MLTQTLYSYKDHDKRIFVKTTYSVNLRMKDRPADMDGSCKYIEKNQSRTADNRLSSSVELSEGLTNPCRLKPIF